MRAPPYWLHLPLSEDAERGARAAGVAGVAHAVGERALGASRQTRLMRLAPLAVAARQRNFESTANPVARLPVQRRHERVAAVVASQDVQSGCLQGDPRGALVRPARLASFSSRTLDQRCR